jgi:hypothetical protein
MLPTRDDEDGEKMYRERQRPFLVLVSLAFK